MLTISELSSEPITLSIEKVYDPISGNVVF